MIGSQANSYFNKIIVVGASRGVGAAVAKHILPRTKKLITVSGTTSIADWIEADVSTKAGITKVSNALGNSTLDGLLYMGGTWENEAFTSNYSFEDCRDRDLENVIAVNLLAPIRLVKSLLPALTNHRTSSSLINVK